MKYLQKISLFLISLSIIPAQSKETTSLSTTDDLNELVQAIETTDKNPAKELLETVADENANAYQEWENHLKTLDQNWSNNVPNSSWVSQATTLANTTLETNNGLTSQLQNEFLAAINGKIQQGESLTPELLSIINTFNDSIEQTTQDEDEDNQADDGTDEDESNTQDDEKEVITQESSEETNAEKSDNDEEEKESDITPSPETSNSTDDSSNTTDNNASNTSSEKEDTSKLREQWQAALRKLANEGINQAEAEQLITQARTIGQQLVDAGGVEADTINTALAGALEDRKKNKKLYAISMQGSSDDITDISNQELMPEQNTGLQQNLQSLQEKVREQEDLIQKQATAATKDKQQMNAEMYNLAQQVAATKASRFNISPEQAEKLIEAKVNAIKAEERQKAATAQKELKDKLLVAAAKKTTTEKGIIASAMDAVSNWWSGKKSPEAQKDSLNKQQEALLNEMVSHYTDEKTKTAIRTAWITLHDALIAIKDDKYWDAVNKKPNDLWIKTIRNNIETLTITHQVMPLIDACDIVIQVLNAQKDMTAQNRLITIEAVRKDLQNKEFAVQKAAREKAAEERLQRETTAEKKKRIKEEQLRTKIAEDQVAANKALEQRSKQQFAQQKTDWNSFIKNLSEQKNATEAQNDASTQEAIKKAKTLLNLTFYDPSQNTYDVEQRLKEQFTNALLVQKKGNKNNTEQMRIHLNMDQFNAAINAIVEELEKA